MCNRIRHKKHRSGETVLPADRSKGFHRFTSPESSDQLRLSTLKTTKTRRQSVPVKKGVSIGFDEERPLYRNVSYRIICKRGSQKNQVAECPVHHVARGNPQHRSWSPGIDQEREAYRRSRTTSRGERAWNRVSTDDAGMQKRPSSMMLERLTELRRSPKKKLRHDESPLVRGRSNKTTT